MKTAEQWLSEFPICGSIECTMETEDEIEFIKQVQMDSFNAGMIRASLLCEANKENWGAAFNDILTEVRMSNMDERNKKP